MPAFVHPPMGVPQLFMRSMHDSYRAGVFQHDYVARTGARPNKARTDNGWDFLNSEAEYIFLVDTDMVWQPRDIIKLKEIAHFPKRPIVAGWALAIKGESKGLWPNAYRREAEGFRPWGNIPPFSDPLKVDAVGGSCVLIHHKVYRALAEKVGGPYPWQDESVNPLTGQGIGEDLTFSQRVDDFTDYEIWYQPDAVFYHVKPYTFGPQEYLNQIERLQS